MSLDQPSDRWQEWRATAGSLLENWRGELSALLAPLVRQIFEADEKPLVVDVSDREVVISQEMEGRLFELKRMELPVPGGARTLAALVGSLAKAGDIVLRLPQEDVLRSKLELPFASARILEQALGHELARISPIDPGEIYFDYAILSRNRAANRSDLELRLIRRNVVDRAVALCREAGLQIGAIGFAGDGRLADWRRFPVDRPAFLRLLWQRWSIPLLSGLVVLLLLAALVATYARGAATQQAIAEELDFTRARAAVIERIEHKIAVVNAQGAGIAGERQQPMLIAILAEVSRVLPDGTWISEVTLHGRKVRLQGYSHSAADLIALFDKSPLFANAEFQAPLTRDPAQNIDHFDLSIDVRGLDIRGKTP